MSVFDRIGFLLRQSDIRGRVYVPRYYNVGISERLHELSKTHELISLGELIERGEVAAATGNEIGKMAYGTGSIPFVRTSDISNWEIKTDPKQGVSGEIYSQYSTKQDVRPGDILFVRDGTYLIGSACLLTAADAKLLYQSHILKFRVAPLSPISAELLLALLSTPIVRMQIRAKQFTADIIDTIGNRYQELVLPVPREPAIRDGVAQSVRELIEQRGRLRERLRRIPLWCEGLLNGPNEAIPVEENQVFELAGNHGFLTSFRDVRAGIFIPRYYDPALDNDLQRLSASHDLVSLGELVEREILVFNTGVEVGKMAYGTGTVPFIRTSDITNWELKTDPKQSVSEEVYQATKRKLDVRPGDIFVVRDGTYLVGASAIFTAYDPKIVYAGGLYKIRVRKPEVLSPFLLLALLNMPIVRRQMRSKQFTRDIIDTLGHRILEVVIPIPKNIELRREIANLTRQTIEMRAQLRNQAKQLTFDLEGTSALANEEQEEAI